MLGIGPFYLLAISCSSLLRTSASHKLVAADASALAYAAAADSTTLVIIVSAASWLSYSVACASMARRRSAGDFAFEKEAAGLPNSNATYSRDDEAAVDCFLLVLS